MSTIRGVGEGGQEGAPTVPTTNEPSAGAPIPEAATAAPATAADADEPELSVDDPWVGRVIAEKYRIVSRLGEGGMAVVYEAENVTIKKRVALKLVDTSQGRGKELAARFSREIEASSKVEHPHVVAAFDGGTLPTGEAYLVSQLVRGDSLHERLSDGPVPWKEACAITAQIADALSAIHAAGFVHRDLTPSNVLLSRGSVGGVHVFVLDLGIAAPIDRPKNADAAPSGFMTTVGVAVGTPGYMSPEQALGKPVEPRSDLYVLGLLFFEMLTAKPVIDGDLALTSIVTQQLQEELKIPPVSETRLPPALDALARELVRVDPGRRPPDATAVRWAFSSWATAGGPSATPSSPSADAVRAMGDRVVASGRGAWTRVAPVVVEKGRVLSGAARDFALRVRERRASGKELAIAGGTLLSTILLCVALGYALGGGDDAALATAADTAGVGGTVADAGTREEAEGAGTTGGAPVTVTLSEVEDTLLHGRTRAEREAAAGTVLSAESGVYPQYARLVAILALADACAARRAQVEAIGALGDIRALPALERISRAPRTGCGRRSREDCYACVRTEVAAAITALEASGRIAPK